MHNKKVIDTLLELLFKTLETFIVSKMIFVFTETVTISHLFSFDRLIQSLFRRIHDSLQASDITS